MKGLLLKDWYIMLRQCRMHIGLLVLMTGVSLFPDTGMAYLVYAIMFAGMIPVAILSAEEKNDWNRFADTLPVSRRAVVTEKYLATLAAVCAGAGLMGLVWAVRMLLTGGDWHMLGRVIAQLCCFGLIFPVMSLPATFRFGVEKGRAVTRAVVVAAVIVIVALELKASEIHQPDLAAAMGWRVPPLLIITAVLLVLSWYLAVRLYEKREL